MHCDTVEQVFSNTDLDFFWHGLGSMGNREGYSSDEAIHAREVDDASAAFMAGSEL